MSRNSLVMGTTTHTHQGHQKTDTKELDEEDKQRIVLFF